MSDQTRIQSMMPSYFLLSEIQDKTTGPSNIGHSNLQTYAVIRSVKLDKYPQYDAYLLNIARDI